MKISIQNDFHNTSTTIDSVDVFENENGRVAVVDGDKLMSAHKELCGMADCSCGNPMAGIGTDGKQYSLKRA